MITPLTRDAATGDITQATVGSVTTSFSRNGYGEIDDVSTQVGAAGVYSTDVLARDASGRILSRREVVEGETHAFGYTHTILSDA